MDSRGSIVYERDANFKSIASKSGMLPGLSNTSTYWRVPVLSIIKERGVILFNYLELARLDDSAVIISYLKNINAPEKIFKVYSDTVGRFLYIIHFFAHEIVYLKRIYVIGSLTKLESDSSACRIRIKINQLCHRSGFATR